MKVFLLYVLVVSQRINTLRTAKLLVHGIPAAGLRLIGIQAFKPVDKSVDAAASFLTRLQLNPDIPRYLIACPDTTDFDTESSRWIIVLLRDPKALG